MSRFTRIRGLSVLMIIAMLLAACGGGDGRDNQELATIDADRSGGDADQVREPDAGDVGDSEQSTVIVGDPSTGSSDELRAPTTPPDPALSPADRQRNQIAGATTMRTSDDVIPEREIDPDAPAETSEPTESNQASLDSRLGAGVVQRDIVIPDGALERTDQDGTGLGYAPGGAPITDERILVEISPASSTYSCQPGIDPECSEVQAEPPPEVPVDVEIEPSEEDAGPPESGDDLCPPGSAPGCSTDPASPATTVADGAATDDGVGAVSGSTDVSADPVPTGVDCDIRPWGRGCDGPAPDPDGQAASTFGDDEDGTESEVNPATDPADGVQVPQEVIDVLLTPPPTDDADDPGDSNDTGEADATDDGAGADPNPADGAETEDDS